MGRNRFATRHTVERTILEFRNQLQPNVQLKFDRIITSLQNHFHNGNVRFDAPDSRKWFTVKCIPQKAIIAFLSTNGNIEFDIDTYPGTEQDITDERNLFTIRRNPRKPNKVYFAAIDINTSNVDLNYFIQKMQDAIDLFLV